MSPPRSVAGLVLAVAGLLGQNVVQVGTQELLVGAVLMAFGGLVSDQMGGLLPM